MKNLSKIKKNNLNIIQFLLSITVLFDAINGFIDMYTPGILNNLIPILRIFLMIYIYICISYFNRKNFYIVSVVLVISFISASLISFINQYSEFSYVFSDLIYITKINYYFVLVIFFMSILEFVDLVWFESILIRNSILMPFLIVLPKLAGLDRVTYEGSNLGSSGFFISNNATNIVMLCFCSFLIYYIFINNKKNWIYSLLLIANLYCLWVQSSKTSIFMLFVFGCIILYLILLDLKSNLSLIKILFFIVFLIVVTILIYMLFLNFSYVSEIFKDVVDPFLSRQQYQLRNQNSFLNYFSSGRFVFLNNSIQYFINSSNLFNFLFGMGESNILLHVQKNAEMDIFDIFFITGILGIMLSYGVSIYVIIKNKVLTSNRSAFTLIILLMLGFSIFAGHVYTDIISSTFLALVLVLSIKKIKGEVNENTYDC